MMMNSMTSGVVKEPKTMQKFHVGPNGAARTPMKLNMTDMITTVANVVGVKMLFASSLIFLPFLISTVCSSFGLSI